MDQIIIEITSIVISSIGIFNFMTHYDVSSTRRNYYGNMNPFQEKAFIINKTMDKLFAFITIFGFLVSILNIIYKDRIPLRLYTYGSYFFVLIVVLAITITFTHIFILIAKLAAKKKWKPLALEAYKDVFLSIEKENLFVENVDKAIKIIELIENILEIKSRDENLELRYDRLSLIFT